MKVKTADSAGAEVGLDPWGGLGDPASWDRARPMWIGLGFMRMAPVRFLVVALLGVVAWAIAYPNFRCGVPDPDGPLLACLAGGAVISLLSSWCGADLVNAIHPARDRRGAFWRLIGLATLGFGLVALSAVAHVLMALASRTLSPTQGLAHGHQTSFQVMEYLHLLLSLLVFRLGAFALPEVMVRGRGGLSAMARSWRLLTWGWDGLGFPALLYLVSNLALGTAMALMLSLRWSPAWAPLKALVAVSAGGVLSLILVWSSLSWLAHYLAVTARAEGERP